MRKIFVLIFVSLLSCGCNHTKNVEIGNKNNGQQTISAPQTEIQLSQNNCSKFFTIESNQTYHKTIVRPKLNKHLIYTDIVLTFSSTYLFINNNNQSEKETYEYNLSVDDTGNGSCEHANPKHQSTVMYNTSIDRFETHIISAFGKISLVKEGMSYIKLNNNDSNQDCTHTYDNRMVYKANLNFTNTPESDAFYLIDSVTMSFNATQNNVEKRFSCVFHPDLFGYDEVTLESNIEYNYFTAKESFVVNNGFLIEYR